ncbi:putative endonuclease [Aneurinibacillus soli]|uniref:UPF0102 protein CB4_01757 n=1 Tax=Aneurinibacillus soli TaxID=1500254 RepID=A0A0U5B2N6_9BACL|nr:YraN family protein [Aneurinibacillus soli]PYE63484.1 putative endonuclease [Aneurinibacillus soli]BAU27583.1 hypothetical protein CB4_01757 [Aneurinibacillus soli]
MSGSNSRRELGLEGEEAACRYLESCGYEIVARNYRIRTAEIDLVMCDGDELVFVEVKTRRTTRFGHGSEAITPHKQRKIHGAALAYMQQYGGGRRFRFDAVIITKSYSGAMDIVHMRNAF